MLATSHEETTTSRQRIYRAAWVQSDDRAYRVGVAVAIWAAKYGIAKKTAFSRMVARLNRLGFVGQGPTKLARAGYLHAMEVA